MRVAPLRMVAFGKEQNVVGHRLKPPTAEGAGVGGGLEVLRAAEFPPARLGHFVVVVAVVVVAVVVVVLGAGGTGHV